MSTTKQRNTKRNEKRKEKSIDLKMDKDGKFILPFNLLSKLKVRLPTGFEDLDLNLYMVVTTSGTTEIGVAKERINLKPISDLQKLAGVQGIITGATKMPESADTTEEMEQLIYQCGITRDAIHVTGNFRAEMVQHLNHWKNLQSSKEVVAGNRASPKDSSARLVLNQALLAMEGVIRRQVIHTCSGSRTKLDVRSLLVELGGSNYFWSRSVVNRLLHPQNIQLEAVLFPTKIENGLKLTRAEICSDKVWYTFGLTERNSLFKSICMDPDARNLASVKPNDEKDELRFERHTWIMIPEVDRKTVVETRKFTPRIEKTENAPLAQLNNVIIQYYIGLAPIGVNPAEFINATLHEVVVDANLTQTVTDQLCHYLPDRDMFNGIVSNGKLAAVALSIAGCPKTHAEFFCRVAAKHDRIVGRFDPIAGIAPLSLPMFNVWRTDIPALAELTFKGKEPKDRIFGKLYAAAAEFVKTIGSKTHALYPVRDRITNYLKQFHQETFQRAAVLALESAAEQIVLLDYEYEDSGEESQSGDVID